MASFAGPGRTGPGLWSWPLLLLLLTGLKGPVGAVTEAGKWILDINSVSFPDVAEEIWAPAREHTRACVCVCVPLCVSLGILAAHLVSIKTEKIIKKR